MGVESIRLFYQKRGGATLPEQMYSLVLWKTQNQQNKKLQNGNLVALRRSSASRVPIKIFYLKNFYGHLSTIIPGGDAIIKPKHLSFLIGGTGKITKGNLKTVIKGWRCRKPGSHPLKL